MTTWLLFTYRLPPQPSSARVAVWRELRRIGSAPLSQGVVAFPELGDLAERLGAIEARVAAVEGVSWRFRLTDLPPDEQTRLQDEWNALRRTEYAEIVEECRSSFEREIEFDLFRSNLTASRVEDLEADLDKLRAAARRVQERDYFGAGHGELDDALLQCEQMLHDFVERVYLAVSNDDEVDVELDALPRPATQGEPK